MTTQSMTLRGLATQPQPSPVRRLTYAHLREWWRMVIAEILCFTSGCGPK